MKDFDGNLISEEVISLPILLDQCECVILGAGAGLSTAAGFDYTGPRFAKYFQDFLIQAK